ncbi:MAG: methyltransferase domain-containing protein [Kiritimatiellia bacterium]
MRYDRYGEKIFVREGHCRRASHGRTYFHQKFLCFRRTGRLLEIGAATGEFLLSCRAEGWETYGVELSQSSAQFAREQYGLDVKTGTIHEAGFPTGFFDVAVAFATLEHVPDPREVAMEIKRVLRAGGYLLLTVPHVNGLSIRLLGRRYRYVCGDHLYYFSGRNLGRMLTSVGFHHIGYRSRWFDPIAFWQDLTGSTARLFAEYRQKQSDPQVSFPAFEADSRARVIHGLPQPARRTVAYLRKGLNRVLETLNLGDVLYVEARA